jgi:hypothetical protein
VTTYHRDLLDQQDQGQALVEEYEEEEEEEEEEFP